MLSGSPCPRRSFKQWFRDLFGQKTISGGCAVASLFMLGGFMTFVGAFSYGAYALFT